MLDAPRIAGLKSLAVLVLLIASAGAVSAEPPCDGRDCSERAHSNDATDTGPGDSNETQPSSVNQTSQPAPAEPGDPDCRPFRVYYRPPGVSWDPILGILELDPDDCYNVFEGRDYRFTYYPTLYGR